MKSFFLVILTIVILCTSCGTSTLASDCDFIEFTSGDESISVNSVVFEKLPVCTVKGANKYFASNSMISVSSVDFKFTKIELIVTIADLSSTLSNLRLKFDTGNGIDEFCIKTAIPGKKYKVLIDRNDSEYFELTDAEWEVRSCLVSSDNFEFDSEYIRLEGANTLVYNCIANILVIDKYGCVIEELELNGKGCIAISYDASYYKIVV